MRRTQSIRAILVAAASLLAVSAHGENLIPNGNFDSFLAPWGYLPGTVTWASLDADGNAASGSALVVNSRSDLAPVTLKSPCLSGLGGDIGAKYRIPAGQAAGGQVRVSLNWYLSSSNCTGEPLRRDVLQETSPVALDNWISVARYQDPALLFQQPPGCPAFCPIPPETRAQFEFDVYRPAVAGSTFRAYVDDVFVRDPTCTPDDNTLCLNGARFRVTADWETASGSGHGLGSKINDATGNFSFFGPDNTEVVVKVLDACADPFHRFWVFGAGLTNVLVTLTVEDTQTGTVKTYINPQGTPFAPIQDTDAFATCP